jgi:flavin-dependent dehydrogenase
VVGADGANSVVRRRLVRPFSRHELSIATGYFLHGATSDEVLLEFVADPPGYIWSFPRPDHLAVGICAPADGGLTSAALRARTARWIERTGIGRGAKCEPYSWPIPSLATADLDRLTIAGDRWYLAGDAAGAVDPITREGIFFALQSAALAADAISGSADAGPRAYVDWMRAEILGELHCAGRIKAMFFRPGFTRVLLDALGRSQRIRIVMADLIAGSQRYGDLKWRLVRTCEFGYAIKALGSTLLASGPCGDSAHPAAVAPSTQRR